MKFMIGCVVAYRIMGNLTHIPECEIFSSQAPGSVMAPSRSPSHCTYVNGLSVEQRRLVVWAIRLVSWRIERQEFCTKSTLMAS